MSNINETIARFIRSLRDSWAAINEIESLDKTGSFKHDWMQAMWELAVEGQLKSQTKDLEFLVPYGDGADVNGGSSRVIHPTGLPTHCVNCVPKQNGSAFDYLNETSVTFPTYGMAVDRFVTIAEDGWYYEQAPFDMVLVDGDEGEMVFRVTEMDMIVVTAYLTDQLLTSNV